MDEKLSSKQIILILAVAVILLFSLNYLRIGINQTLAEKEQGMLTIYINGAEKRTFRGEVTDNMTVLKAIYAASLGGNFRFEYSIDGSGRVTVYGINDKPNSKKGKWEFFLNGRPVGTEDIDLAKVNKGDAIEAKYK